MGNPGQAAALDKSRPISSISVNISNSRTLISWPSVSSCSRALETIPNGADLQIHRASFGGRDHRKRNKKPGASRGRSARPIFAIQLWNLQHSVVYHTHSDALKSLRLSQPRRSKGQQKINGAFTWTPASKSRERWLHEP